MHVMDILCTHHDSYCTTIVASSPFVVTYIKSDPQHPEKSNAMLSDKLLQAASLSLMPQHQLVLMADTPMKHAETPLSALVARNNLSCGEPG